jgi:Holliday junction resolvasome RuvABC endonuclease subunit
MQLTNEEITAIWDGMPDGQEGFRITWGYQQFARAVIKAHDDKLATLLEEVLAEFSAMTDATERWNAAVETIVGRHPESGIDVARARAVIAKATA